MGYRGTHRANALAFNQDFARRYDAAGIDLQQTCGMQNDRMRGTLRQDNLGVGRQSKRRPDRQHRDPIHPAPRRVCGNDRFSVRHGKSPIFKD
jgi:hypothetical protein